MARLWHFVLVWTLVFVFFLVNILVQSPAQAAANGEYTLFWCLIDSKKPVHLNLIYEEGKPTGFKIIELGRNDQNVLSIQKVLLEISEPQIEMSTDYFAVKSARGETISARPKPESWDSSTWAIEAKGEKGDSFLAAPYFCRNFNYPLPPNE